MLQGAGEKEEQIKNLQKQLEEVKESTKKEVDETMNQMIVVSDEADGLRAKVELYESQVKELKSQSEEEKKKLESELL